MCDIKSIIFVPEVVNRQRLDKDEIRCNTDIIRVIQKRGLRIGYIKSVYKGFSEILRTRDSRLVRASADSCPPGYQRCEYRNARGSGVIGSLRARWPFRYIGSPGSGCISLVLHAVLSRSPSSGSEVEATGWPASSSGIDAGETRICSESAILHLSSLLQIISRYIES